LKNILPLKKLNSKLENLASITVKLPKEILPLPGYLRYFIFQRLA
jgi:hypothetical protein